MLTGHRTREFNPGPPSTSRKKRAQVGATGLPRKRAIRVPFFEVATREKKFDVKKRARKALGARGVKTNSRRSRKSLRIPYKVVAELLRQAIARNAEQRAQALRDAATPGAAE